LIDLAASPAENSAGGAVYCRNCEYLLGEQPFLYCPNCGQETAVHAPPFRQLARRFVADYLSPRGRLARTLALLLFRPGELTRRYLSGRKGSYVRPLRLYFGASLIFFLTVRVFGPGNLVRNEAGRDAGPQNAATSASNAEPQPHFKITKPGPVAGVKFDAGEGGWDAPFLGNFQCGSNGVQCQKIRAYMREKYGDSPLRVVATQVRDRVMGYAPNAMFAMLPVFALFTRLLYWRRRLPYGEHFVYALHVHAFTFVLLLGMALLPAGLADWLSLAGMIYFAVAMQSVFGGRKWVTALRYALIGICYPVLLSIVILLTLAAAVII
jgi:hypothetical protein